MIGAFGASTGLGLAGAGLSLAGRFTGNKDVSRAGQATSGVGAAASGIGSTVGGAFAPIALPLLAYTGMNLAKGIDESAQIRKDILAQKDMSVNAHNVKVITNAGKVTLRGPVNTAEEKHRIGEIADRNAGADNVDNQLEVIVKTNSSLQMPNRDKPKGE